MKFILAPIELLELSLNYLIMIRLYANITAGHIVLMSLIADVHIQKLLGSPLSFVLAFGLSLLELLVALKLISLPCYQLFILERLLRNTIITRVVINLNV